jgi:hypothetical protein
MELTLIERWALGLFVVSCGMGHLIIKYGLRFLRVYVAGQKSLGQRGVPGPVIGIVERFFFTPVVAFSGVWAVGVMIPWIVVKMKITWDKENRPLKDDLLLFRTTSLLGNLASMIFALVGGLICRG